MAPTGPWNVTGGKDGEAAMSFNQLFADEPRPEIARSAVVLGEVHVGAGAILENTVLRLPGQSGRHPHRPAADAGLGPAHRCCRHPAQGTTVITAAASAGARSPGR